MDGEPDTLGTDSHPDERAEHEADDGLDWDLDERDRYMAEHEELEEDPEIEVLVRSDE
jgi:hypothetical protein